MFSCPTDGRREVSLHRETFAPNKQRNFPIFTTRFSRSTLFFSPSLLSPLPPPRKGAMLVTSSRHRSIFLCRLALLRLDLCAFLNRLVTVIASIPPANKISCHPPGIARKKRTPSVKSFFVG